MLAEGVSLPKRVEQLTCKFCSTCTFTLQGLMSSKPADAACCMPCTLWSERHFKHASQRYSSEKSACQHPWPLCLQVRHCGITATHQAPGSQAGNAAEGQMIPAAPCPLGRRQRHASVERRSPDQLGTSHRRCAPVRHPHRGCIACHPLESKV